MLVRSMGRESISQGNTVAKRIGALGRQWQCIWMRQQMARRKGTQCREAGRGNISFLGLRVGSQKSRMLDIDAYFHACLDNKT